MPSRKKNSISHCLPCNGETIHVCKVFYPTTLDISYRLVCTYHASKHTMSGTPSRLKWGQNPKKVVTQEIKDGIRAHIKSVPRVESHYCRASTNKEIKDRIRAHIKSVPRVESHYCRASTNKEIKDGIRAHIKSVPRIESHYCRASTDKQYVAQGL